MFKNKYIKYKNKYLKYKNKKIGGDASDIMATNMLGNRSNYNSSRSKIYIASDNNLAIYRDYYNFFTFDYLFLKEDEYTFNVKYNSKEIDIKKTLTEEINNSLKNREEILLESLSDTDDNDIIDELVEHIKNNVSKITKFIKLKDGNYFNNDKKVIENTLIQVFHKKVNIRLALPINILDNIYYELYTPVSDNNQYTIKQWINDDTYNNYLRYLNNLELEVELDKDKDILIKIKEELIKTIKEVLIKRFEYLISSARGVPKWLINLGYNHMASKNCDISNNSIYGCNLRETSINELKYKCLSDDIKKMYIKKDDKNYYLNKTLEWSIDADIYERLYPEFKDMYKKNKNKNNEYRIVQDLNKPLEISIVVYNGLTPEDKLMYIEKDNVYNLNKFYIYRSLYKSCVLRKCYNLII